MTRESAIPGSPSPDLGAARRELASPELEITSVTIEQPTPHVEHEHMTACEVASWLRVDRKTVYDYAARRVIPCRRLGRRYVFSRAAIRAWLGYSSSGSAAGSAPDTPIGPRRLTLVR